MADLNSFENRLTILGCPDLNKIMPALEAACRDPQAAVIVDWLANNLTPDHLATAQQAEVKYQLSDPEQQVAAAFTFSLRGTGSDYTPDLDSELQEKETLRVLSTAADEIIADNQKDIKWLENATKKAQQKFKALQEDCQISSEKRNQAAAAVSSLLADIEKHHASPKLASQHISLQNLEDFKIEDARFLRKLQSCIEKANLKQQQDRSEAGGCISRGPFSNTQIAIEIERLRRSRANHLYNEAITEADIASSEAIVSALQNILRKPEMALTGRLMETEINRAQAHLDRLTSEHEDLVENQLPKACKEVAGKHCLKTIQVRHEDELRRTQYQNGIWEKALEHLSNRAADIYLLTERAKLEGADFAKLHQHAILLTEQIENFIETLQIRTEAMTAEESCNKSMQAASPSFRGPSQVEIERKEASFLDASAAVLQDAEKMQECAGRIHALAFADSSFDRPTLEASEVTEQRLLLEESRRKLNKSINDVRKLQNSYNSKIVAQGGADLNRSVFQKFYNQPMELKHLLPRSTSSKTLIPMETPGRRTTAKKSMRAGPKSVNIAASAASQLSPATPRFRT